MKPYFEANGVAIYHGDMRDMLPALEVRFDTCITDPPYALTANKKGGTGEASLNLRSPASRSRISTGGGFMGQRWDSEIPGPDYWKAILDSVKPGAFCLAFGAPRTFHRLACAIEDSGFQIRDCLMWMFGSGFPKSMDISKALDKAAGAERPVSGVKPGHEDFVERRDAHAAGSDQEGWNRPWKKDPEKVAMSHMMTEPVTEDAKLWNGWGTALKPSWEPIILAMKPLNGTFAQNAVEHGVSGLNIDACRISSQEGAGSRRWPPNTVLDDEAARMLDVQTGILTSGGGDIKRKCAMGYNGNAHGIESRPAGREMMAYGDSGGASRFFYTAKADRRERNDGYDVKNDHPTVKPVDLMRWLCLLTSTPTGGTVLDPFMGSGSTLVAARDCGRPVVGIEIEERFCEIAARRLAQQTLL